MDREIEIAAKWWADWLRRELPPGQVLESHDPAGHDHPFLTRRDVAGETTSLQATLAGHSIAERWPMTAEMVDRFEEALRGTLREHLLRFEFSRRDWDEAARTNPILGGAYRTVAIDYDAPKPLSRAAEAAGIQGIDLRLPMKTIMFIDPGIIRVGVGHQQPIKTIWEGD